MKRKDRLHRFSHIILSPVFCLLSPVIVFFSIYLLWDRDSVEGQPLPPGGVLEDVRNTKHNLSSTPPTDKNVQRGVFTDVTSEICVFCHTPHGASAEATSIRAPIWNRNLSTAKYTLYDQVWSFSFEGELNVGAPTGYSRLCLSCHDGTIAIGSVINAPGSGGYSTDPISNILGIRKMPDNASPVGSGVLTGNTRVIGTKLENDHPVSFVFDSALAAKDTELVDPGPLTAKITDPTPISPMRRAEGNFPGKFDAVQCTSCHNPHAVTYPKFLRASLFQGKPNPSDKLICLYCHDKPGWVGSTHEQSTAMHAEYPIFNNNPNDPRSGYDFDGKHTVAEFACRNCHDPHTVQGAKRLHREGVGTNPNDNKDSTEATCFLCHSPEGTPLIAGNNTGFIVGPGRPAPDIYSHFEKDRSKSIPPDTNCRDFNNGTYLGAGRECGAAMNLALSHGHEPVFISRPQEGVELFSPSPPIDNEFPPGSGRFDNRHIECVDCHNPHQVIPSNRLKGMKGIDIDGNVVGADVPGNEGEPYVYEICFRCHGNSYFTIFAGDRFPDDTDRRSDPRDLLPSEKNLSLRGFSNKRKEFNPNTPDIEAGHTQQSANAAFHPVASHGRNGSPQLCKQLEIAFNLDCSNPSLALSNLTIQCTDCHNSEATSKVRGPVTESNLRPTDIPSLFLALKPFLPSDQKAVGPHGSKFIRILRNRYNTDILDPTRCFEGDNPKGCSQSNGANSNHWENFLLCFQCHDRRAFDPNEPGADRRNSSWTNFFGKPNNPGANQWNANLHMYHLQYTGAYCHECHYNVHSNIEAQNTIYGDGNGGFLPPDSEDGMSDGVVDTHLINFAPVASATMDYKPKWFYSDENNDGYYEFRCYLSCHNNQMNNCEYQSIRGGSPIPPGRSKFWCAGGSNPG